MSPSRRHILGLGLSAGTLALLTPSAYAGQQATAAGDSSVDCEASTEPLADIPGLQFRLAVDYRPNLSPGSQQRLSRATLDFLYASHPRGMNLSLWDLNPREIPSLEDHIAATVRAIFAGVERNLPQQAVDPVLVTSLLYNESRFFPVALSQTGALGIAQFMPDTALEYDLQPLAQTRLWRNYRDVRNAERTRREQAKKHFLRAFGIREFSATAVIEHALKTDSLGALEAWQELVTAKRPEREALDAYLMALRAELDTVSFFEEGESAMTRIDARTGYGAVSAAVDYIARRLAENSGMTSSAVAAYNAGPAAVRDGNPNSVLYGYGHLPAYPETVRYLQRVMVVYSRLRDQLA